MLAEFLAQCDGNAIEMVQKEVSKHLETFQMSFEGYFSSDQLNKETCPFLIDMGNICDEDLFKDDLIDMRFKEVSKTEFYAKGRGEFWCSLSQAQSLRAHICYDVSL